MADWLYFDTAYGICCGLSEPMPVKKFVCTFEAGKIYTQLVNLTCPVRIACMTHLPGNFLYSHLYCAILPCFVCIGLQEGVSYTDLHVHVHACAHSAPPNELYTHFNYYVHTHTCTPTTCTPTHATYTPSFHTHTHFPPSPHTPPPSIILLHTSLAHIHTHTHTHTLTHT